MVAGSPQNVIAKIIDQNAWQKRIYETWPEELKKHQNPIVPMDKRAFVKFAKWLEKCKGEIEDYADFEQKLSEALADKVEFKKRMTSVISRMVDIMLYDLVPCEDKAKAEKLGVALLHIMHSLAQSGSADEVRVKLGSRSDVCVLLLGFAGSHVDDVEPQAEFYTSCGFTVISSSRCIYPHTLHFRQILAIAEALGKTLTENVKLIVHACSGSGACLWAEVAFRWVASLPPFDKLPLLTTCLKGLVFECAPSVHIDPKDGMAISSLGSPFYEARGGESQTSISDMAETWDAFVVFVTLGSIGSMCQQHCPDVEFHKLASSNPAIMSYTRIAGASESHWYTSETVPPGWCPLNWMCFYDCGSAVNVWEVMQLGMFEGSVPTLFLYSAKDVVILPETIEGYIAYMNAFWPPEKLHVFAHKCKDALHCKLWESEERDDCVKVTTDLLKSAGALD